jgi:hypothetical protein
MYVMSGISLRSSSIVALSPLTWGLLGDTRGSTIIDDGEGERDVEREADGVEEELVGEKSKKPKSSIGVEEEAEDWEGVGVAVNPPKFPKKSKSAFCW